jgi:lipopolysaccharide transport protein LptA
MNKKIIILIISISSFMISNLYSEENEINIFSDNLKIDTDQRTSVFTGNVHAIDNALKLWSDKMVVSLRSDKDKIQEILASGNVKIIRLNEESEIYGDTARYFLEDEIIVVIGNVLVKENNNYIKGNKLTVELENSSSIMIGSNSNRVEALIVEN